MRHVLIAAALAVAACGAAGAQSSSPEKGSSIRVTGVGEIFAVPDRAKFRFTLSQTAARPEDAIAGARSGGEELVKALETTSLGSRKITAGLVEPDAEEIRETISGAPDSAASGRTLYRARWVVETDLLKLEQADAVEDVAKRIRPDLLMVKEYGLTYPTAFYEEALKRATHEAEAKADALVRAMGGRLGNPLDVIEEPAVIRQPAGVGGAPSSSMLRIHMKATLSVRYEYKPDYIYEKRRPVATPNVRNDAGEAPETAPAATGG